MKNKLSYIRLYVDRARGYIGYANFFMIFAVFAENTSFFGALYAEHKALFLIVGLAIFLCSLLILGYADVKLGILKSDMKVRSEQNPYMVEILRRVKDIDERLNDK